MSNTGRFQTSALARYVTYRASAWIERPLIGPRSAVLSVIPGCNSRCYYCPIYLNNHLPRPTTDELAGAITQLHALGVRKLTISGGEPLQRPDIVELVHHAATEGMTVNVLTNGLLLDENLLEALISAGAWSIVLSLDTLRPDLYKALRGVSIHKIMPALRQLETASRAGRIKVALTCVVTMHNLPDLAELASYALEHGMGVSYQAYNLITGFERRDLLPTAETMPALRAAIDQLISLKHQGAPVLNSEQFLRAIPMFMSDRDTFMREIGHCHAGYTSINVDSNMDVRPCWSLPATGNLRVDELEDIWDSASYKRARQDMVHLRCPGCLLVCHHEYQYG